MVDSENQKRVRVTALKISFLMPHQDVMPDLKELATELDPHKLEINRESPEYLLGAYEALNNLIMGLERKGPQFK